MYFYRKSMMAASSHSSCQMTTKEVLDKVFVNRDPEFSYRESEEVSE